MTTPHGTLAWPIRWLLTTKGDIPPSISKQLESGLYTSLPIFLGGVANSITIAALATWRHPSQPFIAWLALEIGIAILRLTVVLGGRRTARAGGNPPLEITAVLACAWAASVGFGLFISLTSGDWVLATIVCLSSAAMTCGICLRNFGTPRLVGMMCLLTLGPGIVAGMMTDESAVAIISVQLPLFVCVIFPAAFSLHRLMVSRMTALADLEKSESFNRTILDSSPDYMLMLDEKHEVVFCHMPNSERWDQSPPIGLSPLTLIRPEYQDAAATALAAAAAGKRGNVVVHHVYSDGSVRWFDIVAKRILDDSGRIIIAARDITHQKASEERALWVAQHDPLTRLPNRAVLLDHLDARLHESATGATSALMMVDVDHFKTVNDTLGHDAGDALLCNFAYRLRSALAEGDLVARTGGDEFALLVSAESDEDVEEVAKRIHAALANPFLHEGRLLQCSASIGASLLPRDGATRSEIVKTADIALYAAKAGGRAQLKVFEPSMKAEVEHRDEMMASARDALRRDQVRPYFQPKVALAESAIVGVEALMRWTDNAGILRGPDELKAAFEDSALGIALSRQMIERTLDCMKDWLRSGVAFGHVALNVTAADFRRPGFASDLLEGLASRGIGTSFLQVEVTETVFLGHGADHVEAALGMLSRHGVRIALDDFGTGYASLSHLSHFPVDLLKIDRSFIGQLGQSAEADVITGAVVNLGRSLGLEVVAEGVETADQEARLRALGCDTGQGFLYAKAIPAAEVPALLAGWRPRRLSTVADAA